MKPARKSEWRLLAALAFVLSVSCSRLAEPGANRPSAVAVHRDHATAISEWSAWRDRAIRELLAPSRDEQGRKYLDIDVVAGRAQQIHEQIRRLEKSDPEQFAANAPIGARIATLKKFTGAVRQTANAEHGAGFSLSDRQYTAYARPQIAMPELLRSQEFLRAVSNPASYREAFEMIERENRLRPPAEKWLLLLYKSQFLLTPDNTTYGRFLIHVPGEPEKWIQFGIVTPGMKPVTIHSFSMVSVARTGKESPRAESYIIDFWRRYKPNGIKLSTRLEAGKGTQNCYNCHKTPVIPIHPAEEYVFDRHGRLIVKTEGVGEIARRMNKLIGGYGPPYFGGWLDPSDFGPPLGPERRERTDAFLARATAGLKIGRESFDRLRKHMDCARCHNMKEVAPLNYPLATRTDVDFTELRHPDSGEEMPIARKFVENGWMPPKHDLTLEERKALWRCLQAEYYDCHTRKGLLVEWLRGENADATR